MRGATLRPDCGRIEVLLLALSRLFPTEPFEEFLRVGLFGHVVAVVEWMAVSLEDAEPHLFLAWLKGVGFRQDACRGRRMSE